MTLGEGQGAKTDGEHLFVILVLLTGAMVNAALFGQMALLIANFNRAGSRYQEKMDSVSEHTKNLGLDVGLCHKIQDYCEWEWQLNRCLDRNLFIASLSPALQDEICVLIAYEVVRRVPFMKDMEEACLVEMLKCIVSTLHLRDDLVVRSGRIGRDMCTSVLGRMLRSILKLTRMNMRHKQIQTPQAPQTHTLIRSNISLMFKTFSSSALHSPPPPIPPSFRFHPRRFLRGVFRLG